jgi:uncharacterized protein
MIETNTLLPLFPLNSILLPGMPLRLHVFEPRYRELVAACMEHHEPFGVALLEKGAEALDLTAVPYQIGCTAQIDQVHRLPDGQIDLTANGIERFRILNLDRESHPYTVARIEPFPLVRPDSGQLIEKAELLKRWMLRYMHLQVDGAADAFTTDQMPEDPEKLAYLAVALLPVEMRRKQEIFSIPYAPYLLQTLLQAYRLEVTLAQNGLTQPAEAYGLFSFN